MHDITAATVERPSVLWRLSAHADPWHFPDGEDNVALASHLSRHAAVVDFLLESQRMAVRRPRGRRKAQQVARRVAGIGVIEESMWIDDPDLGMVMYRQSHETFPNSVFIQSVEVQGGFLDLRTSSDVEDLVFEIEMNRDLAPLLGRRMRSGVVDESLKAIMSLASVDGRECGGYVTVNHRDMETWHVFPSGIASRGEVEELGASIDSYREISQLASTLGLMQPLAPGRNLSKELLRSSISPSAYAAAATAIDGDFALDVPDEVVE